MGVDAVAVADRALAWLAVYQAVGAVLFVACCDPSLPLLRERARRLGGFAGLCGAVLVLLQWPLTAARMAGDYSGLTDAGLLRMALHSSHGSAGALMLGGLSVLAIGAFIRPLGVLRWAGIVLVVCAPALTGHTSVHAQRMLLAPLLVLHILIGAFWLGSLAPLWCAVRLERPEAAGAVLRRFGSFAIWLIPCIAFAGIGIACALIDDWTVLRRPYGLLLLGKLSLFGVLMGLAALNRWRFTPALAEAPESARRALQRSIMLEYLLIAAVLAMTATLTTLFGPED